jgi:hypothetical protein
MGYESAVLGDFFGESDVATPEHPGLSNFGICGRERVHSSSLRYAPTASRDRRDDSSAMKPGVTTETLVLNFVEVGVCTHPPDADALWRARI